LRERKGKRKVSTASMTVIIQGEFVRVAICMARDERVKAFEEKRASSQEHRGERGNG